MKFLNLSIADQISEYASMPLQCWNNQIVRSETATSSLFDDSFGIDHFTVVCLVSWPLNENEAGGDPVLIEIALLLLCKLV